MISPETISLVRDRTDMVAVVQESVPSLKRRGRSWSGLCPFHKEKSPSFHVNPERGFFKCFGCGEGGDVITFVMKEQGYTFAEAVRALAERVGVVIEEDARERTEVDRAKKQRDDVYAANALAATWFEDQLRRHPLRSIALEELARRGIVPGSDRVVDEALQAFRIGYAPAEWDGLATFFRQQGISPQVAELAGLLAPRSSGSGHYDRFRHRLMFSVLDTQGRVVAFSGRALDDPPGRRGPDPGSDRAAGSTYEKPAKYINSKETPVYTKGHVLFGLFQARHAIRLEETTILVEGNFDVFSLHARGMANVVAPLGTAFTPEQAALLKRYAPNLVLLFDGDAAGRKAVLRARDACTKAGLVAKVAALPEGMDPDDFARTRGVEPLKELVASAKGLLEFLVEAELDGSFVAADAREKLTRVDRVAELIASEPDPLVRMMAKGYADRVAGRLDILGADAFRVLEQKIRAAARKVAPAPNEGTANVSRAAGIVSGAGRAPSRSPKTPGSAERRAIVAALLDYPSLLDDGDVQRACTLLEGPAALTVAALRRSIVVKDGEKALDTQGFLAQIPQAIQAFASERLAAPVHESEREAKEALLTNAQKLERLLLAEEAQQFVRELERPGDREDETKLLREVEARARRRHESHWARPGAPRAADAGATADEERPKAATPQERREQGGHADEGDEGDGYDHYESDR